MNNLIPKSFKQEILKQNKIVKYNDRLDKLINYIKRRANITITEKPCFLKGCRYEHQAIYIKKIIKLSNYFIGEVYCNNIKQPEDLNKKSFIEKNRINSCSGKSFILFKSLPPELSCSPNSEDVVKHMVFKR